MLHYGVLLHILTHFHFGGSVTTITGTLYVDLFAYLSVEVTAWEMPTLPLLPRLPLLFWLHDYLGNPQQLK
jgi:hypothetical protein